MQATVLRARAEPTVERRGPGAAPNAARQTHERGATGGPAGPLGPVRAPQEAAAQALVPRQLHALRVVPLPPPVTIEEVEEVGAVVSRWRRLLGTAAPLAAAAQVARASAPVVAPVPAQAQGRRPNTGGAPPVAEAWGAARAPVGVRVVRQGGAAPLPPFAHEGAPVRAPVGAARVLLPVMQVAGTVQAHRTGAARAAKPGAVEAPHAVHPTPFRQARRAVGPPPGVPHAHTAPREPGVVRHRHVPQAVPDVGPMRVAVHVPKGPPPHAADDVEAGVAGT